MNLNKVFIIGNLTRDVDLRTTPSGMSVASVGIATNRVWNDKSGSRREEVEFHNVVLWGKQAELAKQYLAKGRMVMIEGRLQTRSWDDKQTGQKRFRTEIIAERIQFGPRQTAPRFSEESSGGLANQSKQPQPDPLDEIQLDEALGPEDAQTEIRPTPF
jgi:single-strand DNA-binding protein